MNKQQKKDFFTAKMYKKAAQIIEDQENEIEVLKARLEEETSKHTKTASSKDSAPIDTLIKLAGLTKSEFYKSASTEDGLISICEYIANTNEPGSLVDDIDDERDLFINPPGHYKEASAGEEIDRESMLSRDIEAEFAEELERMQRKRM